MRTDKKGGVMRIALIGSLIVAVIIVLGTIWTGQSARNDTEEAVRSVSLLYLDELAGRREQVVANNLKTNISNIEIAIGLMTEEDLSDLEHLQMFQAKMKKLYGLEKFAFVDTDGRIYTSLGMQDDIDQYQFDYRTISEPEISIKNLESDDKKVIIAIPVDHLSFGEEELVVCFMEIDMDRMLEGISMQADNNGATFCNIYTNTGVALSNVVLGGLASEDNLLSALERAEFADGYSLEKTQREIENCEKGVASFSYEGIQETLAYVPVEGTNWLLTYLIRESVISEEISSISDGIIARSITLSILTAIVLLGMFTIIIVQTRRSAQLELEKETAEAENRIKREELEARIALQEKLLEEEKTRVQLDRMITALASDYRSVYYVSLDEDIGVCVRTDHSFKESVQEGEQFPYLESFRHYAEAYVAENYRDDFLKFIEPDAVRKGLEKEPVIACRYLVERNGKESYEMLRMAGVRHAEDREDHIVHAVGVGFTDIDEEMRRQMDQSQALSDALSTAEESSKAKTIFLSNMSHEIRTPMNAIIGLDNVALNDPEISDKTREYLEKIGGSAQHLLSLINDILDMSRIESGRMTLRNEEFSFSKLLEQVNVIFSGQCAEKNLNYNCRINGEVDDYYIGDSVKLRQVLINILGNAVKFTPEGGSVDLSVERIAQYEGKSTLRFVITDTGIGMSPDYLPHIFDSFSQENTEIASKYGSSGLGMAIVKSIVEMMNGTIEVESEKGTGSTFTVTVTLGDAKLHADHPGEADVVPQELSVLVVDDDPIACEHAKLILEKVGIASETAQSGKEAIEMVTLRHARREPYNLILIDWKMPEMDGVETTREIRSIIGNESAIIILTAYRWDDVLDKAIAAGVDSFIAKPLFAGNVLEEFKEAIRRKNVNVLKDLHKAELNGRRILIAEDIDINAEILVMLLEIRGMEADVAVNGKLAVEMFMNKPAWYYDAVLMDMRMPEMNGLEASQAIRKSGRDDAKEIPIIALTANAFDEDVQRSLQGGLNAHLSKPVDPDNLYTTLESLIHNHQ